MPDVTLKERDEGKDEGKDGERGTGGREGKRESALQLPND